MGGSFGSHNTLENEWYPVKDLEWILDDDSAAVLVFGVTAK